MKIEKLKAFIIISAVIICYSCKKDDDAADFEVVPARDKTEVYNENIAEIDTYLKTHTFNYEDFDFENPYSSKNDNFKIVFDTLDLKKTPGKKPLTDFVKAKIVKDSDIDYKLYILTLREGKGDVINELDEAIVLYKGMTLDGNTFDQSDIPVKQNLTQTPSPIGIVSGVLIGYKEAILEFKTATTFVENTDGSIAYKENGIGAVFIPSGLGYFSKVNTAIPAYSPLIFNIDVLGRSYTDFENDFIPSYIENANKKDDKDNDTDGDQIPDYIDTDDDGDGVFTKDEISKETITGTSIADIKAKALELPKNKILINIVKVSDTKYEGKLIVFNDVNKNNIYDHLDKNYPEEQ